MRRADRRALRRRRTAPDRNRPSRRRWRCPGVSVTMRVGLGALAGERFADHDHVGRMDLVGGEQALGARRPSRRRRGGGFRAPCAGSSCEPVPMLRPLVDAVGNAADAREIAVPDAGGLQLIEQPERRSGSGFVVSGIRRLVVSRNRFVKTLRVPPFRSSFRGATVRQGRGASQSERSKGGSRTPAGATASTLNSCAHRVGSGKALDLALQALRASPHRHLRRAGRRVPEDPCRAGTRLASQDARRARATGRLAASAAKSTCAVRSASPGLSSTSSWSMRPDRLQRVADAGLQMAVVDEQAGAAVAGDARGDRLHQRVACRRDLDDRAIGRVGGIGRQQGRIEARRRRRRSAASAVVEADRALQPLACDLDELAERDGVEELVADDEQRLFGQLVDACGARRTPLPLLGERRLLRRPSGAGWSRSWRIVRLPRKARRRAGQGCAACPSSACRVRGRSRRA